MATVETSTGSNTSATNQAVLKVAVGGCITEALKSALESQLIIEFPDALGGTSTIDVLTSTAVNQIVTQLVEDPAFAEVLNSTVSSDTYVDTVVESLLANTGFADAVNAAVLAALAEPTNVTNLGALLCADSAFQSCIVSQVVNSPEMTTFTNALIVTYTQSLDLFRCTEAVYTVEAGNVVNVTIGGMDSNNYYFDYQVQGYTNTGGGTSSAGSLIVAGTRTPTNVTISFPSALPGDSVELYWVRIKCSI